MTTWSVYGLVDPRNRTVFYVGVTKWEPDRRLAAHCSDPASSAWDVCRAIKGSGLRVEVCIFGQFLERAPARLLEGRMIVLLPHLVNCKTHHGLPSTVLLPNWKDLSSETGH
jgi:hypothetical protein